MASDKKRRKAANQARKGQRPQTGPFRHPDGDRRHRGKMTADEGRANKEAIRLFGAGPPPTLPGEHA